MVTLTIHIPVDELDALRYACAHTDEKLYVHEQTENSAMLTVTLEVRSPEMLFYLTRTFDERLRYEEFSDNLKRKYNIS